MAVSPLTVETVVKAEALTALEADWRALETRCRIGLPFQTWCWNEAWWRHFAEGRLAVRDRLRVLTARTADGELVGVAPMMLSHRPGVGPLCVRTLGHLGADPNITELRVPLCDPAHEGPAYVAFLDHLRGRADEWDWTLWSGLRTGSEPEQLVAAAPGVSFGRDIPNYLLELPATWDELKASRPRNLKESLRKCYNSLKRDNHAFALEVATTPTEVRAALGRFLELHVMRSQLKEAVRHPNVFASPNARAFLLEVCEHCAALDQARIFQLRIDGTIVAIRIAFALGDTLYLYYSGYDPAWGKYSVMTTTVAEALKFAIEHGFRWANLSTGNDVSKTRWAPKEVVYREALQLSPSRRGRLSGAVYRMLASNRLRPVVRVLMGRRAKIS
jgi:CelD/BcsL family acetyltransferase involved in cellulose biosynthesis